MILNIMPICTQETNILLSKTIEKSTVAYPCNMEMFNLTQRILLCALKFHKTCRKQTLLDIKYLFPYINSIFSFFSVNFLPKFVKVELFLSLACRFLWMLNREIGCDKKSCGWFFLLKILGGGVLPYWDSAGMCHEKAPHFWPWQLLKDYIYSTCATRKDPPFQEKTYVFVIVYRL